MVVTATDTRRVARRYRQQDLHDLRRVAGLWWSMLEVNQVNTVAGLSQPESALREAVSIILSRIRRDPLGQWALRDPQMAFDEMELTDGR